MDGNNVLVICFHNGLDNTGMATKKHVLDENVYVCCCQPFRLKNRWLKSHHAYDGNSTDDFQFGYGPNGGLIVVPVKK